MTCITLAQLGKVDDRLRKRLEDSKALKDHIILGEKYLLATSDNKVHFEGVDTLELNVQERQHEELIALTAEADVDYSMTAFRIYADPFNTPSLVDDSTIADGFIFKTNRPYDSPEENLKLLRALKSGEKITAVHRRSGELSAVMNKRIMLMRSGQYHPSARELLALFQSKARKATKLQVLAFNIKDGKITIDNTYKPKAVKLPAE